MVAILSRLPNAEQVRGAAQRHRGKIAGLLAGTIGTAILTLFLVVAITGVPYGGDRTDPARSVVYPNF